MSEAASDSPTVTIDQLGSVLIVHLDDGKVNAVSFEITASVTEAIKRAGADDDIKAVVIHGRPGKFSAGFDLSVVQGDDADAARSLVADGAQLVHTLYSAPVPVVAACTGHAIAAGAMLLSGCDYRVGPDDDSVKIAMNEVAIGMALPDWALTILDERLSPRYLQRSAVLAEVFSPAVAVQAGFLDEVVPVDTVLERSIQVANTLGEQLVASAHVISKRRLRGAMLDRLQTQIDDYRATGTL